MKNDSVSFLLKNITRRPETAIILGSGLGEFTNFIENPITIPYSDIPEFAQSTVEGHQGELVFGQISGKNIVAMRGRMHYYEGLGIDAVVYPVKVLAEMGIKNIIITNAAGGVNLDFSPGDLMVITDHINFSGTNPLIGKNDDTMGPRFLDQTFTYDKKFIDLATTKASNLGMTLQKGVYMWFSGPVYETPAEINFARIIGADAVGMSTVPEVIVAHHRGIRVLGISCITNYAAGILEQPLNHQEVIEVSSKVTNSFQKLIIEIIKDME